MTVAEPLTRRRPSPRLRRVRRTRPAPAPASAKRTPWSFTGQEIRPALPWVIGIASPTLLVAIAVVVGGYYLGAVPAAPLAFGLVYAAGIIAAGAVLFAMLLLRYLQRIDAARPDTT